MYLYTIIKCYFSFSVWRLDHLHLWDASWSLSWGVTSVPVIHFVLPAQQASSSRAANHPVEGRPLPDTLSGMESQYPPAVAAAAAAAADDDDDDGTAGVGAVGAAGVGAAGAAGDGAGGVDAVAAAEGSAARYS